MEYDGKPVTFNRKSVLGVGASGLVFSGTWGDLNVAIKRVLLLKLNVREESTLKAVGNHTNVVDCYGTLKDDDFMYMILELCDATVEKYCRGEYKGIVPSDCQALYQMADGLHFLHSKNFAHRDISTNNVLIKLTDDGVVMKIADFGVCKPVSKNGSLSMSGDGNKGTITFMAPELLRQMQNDEIDCSTSNESQSGIRGHISNDIFSLGCVFYRFLTKVGHPFMEGAVSGGYSNDVITSNILANIQFLERLGKEQAFAKSLIAKMIQPDKNQRPQLAEVKEELNSHLNTEFPPSNVTLSD